MANPVNFKGKSALKAALDSAYSAKSAKGFAAAKKELNEAFGSVVSSYRAALKKGGEPGKAEAASIRSAMDNAFSKGKKAKKAEGTLKDILDGFAKKWEGTLETISAKKSKKASGPVNFKGKSALKAALDSAYSAKSAKGFAAARQELKEAFGSVVSSYRTALKKGGEPGKAEAASIRSAMDNAFSKGKKAKKAEGELKKILDSFAKKWEDSKEGIDEKRSKKKASQEPYQAALFASEDEGTLSRTAKKSRKRRRKKKKKKRKGRDFRGKKKFYSAMGDFAKYDSEVARLSKEFASLGRNKSLSDEVKKERKAKLVEEGKKLKKHKGKLKKNLLSAFKRVLSTYRSLAKKKKRGRSQEKQFRAVMQILNSDLSERAIRKSKGLMRRALKKMRSMADAAVKSVKRMKKGYVNDATLRSDLVRIAYLSGPRNKALLLPLIVTPEGRVASSEGLRKKTIRLASEHPHLREGLRPFLTRGGATRTASVSRTAAEIEDDRRVRSAIIRYAYANKEHQPALLNLLEGELDY